jgi:ribonuclease D
MYIRTAAPLRDLCEQARATGLLALDVEFIREHSYIPKLALVQIAVGETCAIVDPLEVDDLSPLFEIVASPHITKVLHAAFQDMEVLYWRSEKPPVRLFDTQIAAAMVGLGEQLSYGNLVERLLGITLSKGESYSAWLQRPLSPSQIDYALNDARYLLALHAILKARLEAMNRTAWATEEFRKFEALERYQRDPRTLFRRVRRANNLSSIGLAVLRELAAWRDREARAQDKPPGSILHDDQLVDIARKTPRTLDDLQRLRGLPSRIIERSGNDILAMVSQGLAMIETERPQPIRSHRQSQSEKVIVRFLDACLKALCAREKMPVSAVANRGDLETLVRRYRQGRLAAAGSPLLEGWRGALVGYELLAVLEGHMSVALDPHDGNLTFTPRPLKP